MPEGERIKEKYTGIALEMEPADAIEHMKNAVKDTNNFCEGAIFGELDGDLVFVLYTPEKGYLYTFFNKERIQHLQGAIDYIMKTYYKD